MKIAKKIKSIPAGVKDRFVQLSTRKYSQLVPESVSIDAKRNEIKIALPELVLNEIEDVKFIDSKGMMTSNASFNNFSIKNNQLIINLTKMPVAGKLTVVVIMSDGAHTVKYTQTHPTFGQWKLESGILNNLIITPWSNGVVRPVRRQILINNFKTTDRNIIVQLPKIDVERVLFTTSDNEIDVEFTTSSNQLVIDTESFAPIYGQSYVIQVENDGVIYDLFEPTGMLVDTAETYKKIAGTTKFVHVSKQGLLSFVWSSDQIEVQSFQVVNKAIELTLFDTPILGKNDQFVLRRYDDLLPLKYELNKNKLVLTVDNSDFVMAKGFPYTLEIGQETENQNVYTPLMVKEQYVDELGEKTLSMSSIELAGTPEHLETIVNETLDVSFTLVDGLQVLETTENVVIEQVLARYKERPVFSDITSGVSKQELLIIFSELHVVYRKNGQLMISENDVRTVMGN